jgi:2,3-bisphosphoglycerate-independent phosphoglycerate mutase
MKDSDIALRCNVVTVAEDGDYEEKEIIDHMPVRSLLRKRKF